MAVVDPSKVEVHDVRNHPLVMDLTGRRFDRLEVVAFVGLKWRNAVWACLCDCGNTTIVKAGELRNGHTRSCGCIKVELVSERSRTHGHAYALEKQQTSAYRAWCDMKTRCTNPNRDSYKRYGGRGIKICDRWINSFENFFEDMGPPPSKGMSLDRKDGDQGYCKENCRWASPKEQANNTSRNRHVIIDGQQLTAKQAAEKFGVSEFTIYGRLNRGLEDREAVFGKGK